jgi:hypothetical protein
MTELHKLGKQNKKKTIYKRCGFYIFPSYADKTSGTLGYHIRTTLLTIYGENL